MKQKKTICILGAGNLGCAIIRGLLATNYLKSKKIIATRRDTSSISDFSTLGIQLESDNRKAAEASDAIIVCVQPGQLNQVVQEVKPVIRDQTIISTVTGATIERLQDLFGKEVPLVRAMPNTAIAVRQSMTCLSSSSGDGAIALADEIFTHLGQTIVINDELMQAATVLGASGIAFWLRLIRASTQGGIQMGFDAPDAQKIAVQASLGAASLLAHGNAHPEPEIDKVTTPMGCTIAGLNEMEHMGLSSAVIKGLVTSFKKINQIKEEQ